MSEQIVSIPLASILPIDNVNDRPLDEQHVASLVATNEPDAWPPILVTRIGDEYGRVTGKHRIAAAHKLQRKDIKAVIRDYKSIHTLYCDMWEDNIKNGLPLSVKERKEYAVRVHEEELDISLREIGRRAGLPHQTVKTAIEESESQESKEKLSEENEKVLKISNSCQHIYKSAKTLLKVMEGDSVEHIASLLVIVIEDVNKNAVNAALLKDTGAVLIEASRQLKAKIKGK